MANMINIELTHANGTVCRFTFNNYSGLIAATVEATCAPRTIRIHLSGSSLTSVLYCIEDEAMCGDAYIEEAVADLAFEIRHLLEFAKTI